MKRFNKIITFLLVIFLVTGCMKYNANMGISENGEVKLDITLAMANYMADMAGEGSESEGFTISDREEYEKLGFAVEDYKDSEWDGFKLSKTYKLEEVSTSNPVTVHLDKLVEEEIPALFQSLGNDVYKGHFIIEATSNEGIDEGTSLEGTDSTDLSMLYDSMDLSYTVTLPSAPISHNADKVEGNTLTWKLKADETTDIQYEFSLKKGSTSNETPNSGSNSNTSVADGKKDNSTLWIIVGAGAAVVVVIIVVVVVASKKKKNTNAMMNMNQTVGQMPGVQPVMQPTMTVPMAPAGQPVAPQQPVMPAAPTQQPVVTQTQQAVSGTPVVNPTEDTTANNNQSTNIQ